MVATDRADYSMHMRPQPFPCLAGQSKASGRLSRARAAHRKATAVFPARSIRSVFRYHRVGARPTRTWAVPERTVKHGDVELRRAAGVGGQDGRLPPLQAKTSSVSARRGQGIGAALGLSNCMRTSLLFHGKWRFSIVLSGMRHMKKIAPDGRICYNGAK